MTGKIYVYKCNVKKSLLKWAAVKDEFEEFIGGVMLMIIVLIYFKD